MNRYVYGPINNSNYYHQFVALKDCYRYARQSATGGNL
jgi:hypothetical protein